MVDSLPTGPMRSWLIVAGVSLIPIIILFLAEPLTGSSDTQRGKPK